jgi:hypothetical protein
MALKRRGPTPSAVTEGMTMSVPTASVTGPSSRPS